MNRVVPGIMCLLCVGSPPVAGAGMSEEDAAKALKAHYEGKPHIDTRAAVKKLASAAKADRDQAAKWLQGILAESVKDEKSGEAPWQATPFFGSGGQNPARELRKWIAIELSRSDALPAALPILRWYFADEFVPAHQVDAAAALAGL